MGVPMATGLHGDEPHPLHNNNQNNVLLYYRNETMKLLDRDRSVLLPPTTGGKLVKVNSC